MSVSQKMNSRKAVIALTVVLCNMALMPGKAFATQNILPQGIADTKLIIEPRYVALTQFTSSLKVNNGVAECEGNATVSIGNTCNARLELQQKGTSTWETIQEWSSSGRKNIFSDNVFLVRGYSYRLKLTAEVYDSSGRYVEGSIGYSNIVAY